MRVPLEADEAEFLGMLEIVTMSLGDLAVDCLLDPVNLVNKP